MLRYELDERSSKAIRYISKPPHALHISKLGQALLWIEKEEKKQTSVSILPCYDVEVRSLRRCLIIQVSNLQTKDGSCDIN